MKYKKRIPGSKIISAKALVNEENKKVSNDTLNRQYVVKTTISYIKSGLSLEQALDKIMEDNIVNEFKYLEKNGIDIKRCFKDWVEREIKRPRRNCEKIR